MCRVLGHILTPAKEGKPKKGKDSVLVDNWGAASLPCAPVSLVGWEVKYLLLHLF